MLKLEDIRDPIAIMRINNEIQRESGILLKLLDQMTAAMPGATIVKSGELF